MLIGFTPAGLQNLVEFGEYFSFLTRMLLVFGIAFEIPLFVIMLNLAGVVSGKALGRYRPWIILGTFVFAAVATPSTDPFSMLMLAVPMLVLFLLAEVDRPVRGPGARPGQAAAPTSGPTTSCRRCDRPDERTPSPTSTRSTCPTGWATADVTWTAETGVRAGHHVARRADADGRPRPARTSPATCWPSTRPTRCRWPATTCAACPPGLAARPDAARSSTTSRLTLAVPGTVFTADLVLDALSRLAKAVGADPGPLRRRAADRRRVRRGSR